MQIQSIRNATMRIQYHGHLFVCDPYLADKLTRPSYAGKSLNPLVDLPMPATEVIAGAEFFLLSHLHSDHFDPAAIDLVPKESIIFCQPTDVSTLAGKGFTQVNPVDESVEWNGITFRWIPGQHGSGSVLNDIGFVSGFVFAASDEPTVFWISDSVLTDSIRNEIKKLQPDIIITHSSGAIRVKEHILILTDAAQTIEICQLAPRSKVVAVHMEALDHGTVSRADLREYATTHDVSADRLLIPADGEIISL